MKESALPTPLAAIILGLASCTVAAPLARADANANDIARQIVGTWGPASGDAVTDPLCKKVFYDFRGNGVVILTNKELGREIEGKYTVAGNKLTMTFAQHAARVVPITIERGVIHSLNPATRQPVTLTRCPSG